MNMTILIGFPGGFPPVQIFIPLDTRPLELVEFAHQRYGPAEIQHAIVAEKARQIPVYDSALGKRGKDHAHKDSLVWKIVGKSS